MAFALLATIDFECRARGIALPPESHSAALLTDFAMNLDNLLAALGRCVERCLQPNRPRTSVPSGKRASRGFMSTCMAGSPLFWRSNFQTSSTRTPSCWRSIAHRQAIARWAMTEAAAQLRKGLGLVSSLPDGAACQRQELDLRVELAHALVTTGRTPVCF